MYASCLGLGACPISSRERVHRLLPSSHDLEPVVLAAMLLAEFGADAEREELYETATGLGGRSRLLGDDSDKARKTVTARIRYTLKVLRQAHPALGAHLSAHVHTGIRCSYPPDQPIRWEL